MVSTTSSPGSSGAKIRVVVGSLRVHSYSETRTPSVNGARLLPPNGPTTRTKLLWDLSLSCHPGRRHQTTA
ncbi:hypothetical protein E2C01_001673 [Portunus trituberculatus]|uniref:Uncharacterized protein n=1 Tax=Portunus trituberculatus TaxID=210409 RepID=A0A5B7CJV6_PORTR|nr:hypothetical protein [Portunus trituberculatus]